MPDTIQHGTPLTYADAVWLLMDDPTNLMTVTAVFTFGEPVAFDRLRDTLQARIVERFPRMRHRVERGGLSPTWVSDPTFDVEAHVHRRALPAPGDEAALREVVSDLMATPLDPSKPLWQCHLLEGFGAGCAVVVRLHQSIGDGVALVHLLLSAADLGADAPLPRPGRRLLPVERGPAERIVSLLDGARRLVSSAVRQTHGATKALVKRSVESILHPSQVLDYAQTLGESATVLMDVLTRAPEPETILRGPLGVPKRTAWSRPFALAGVRAAARAASGTVNDVLAAAAAGALRRYLLSRGPVPKDLELRAGSPVSLRLPGHHPPDDLGNRFAMVYLPLAVGAEELPERFRAVKARMDHVKRSPEPFVAFQLMKALGVAPADVADLFVNLFGTKSSLVLTNVVGPGQGVFVAGQRVERILVWVPQSGRVGLGMSFFSYAGEVVLAVASDRGLVPDPEALVAAFEEELDAVSSWAGSLPAAAAPGAAARRGRPRTRRRPRG